MPRKKKDIKVGALVSAFRRKEPGLGLVIAIYTREQMEREEIRIYEYNTVMFEFAAKIKWIKRPTHFETHENDISMLPITWLRVIGEAK
jgi:hypothetical protein